MIITREGWAVAEDDTHGSRWVEQRGTIDFDSRMAEYCRANRLFGPGDTVVDVGACLGHYTVPFAEVVGLTGRVHAFEPCEVARECLIHNTRVRPQVTVHPFALGEREDEMAMRRHPNLGMTHLDPGGDGPLRASIRTLDSFALPDRVAFIKIDTEGWELFVLRGAERLIVRDHPIIMWEVAGYCERAGYKRGDTFAWLSAHGYAYPPDDFVSNYDAVARYVG